MSLKYVEREGRRGWLNEYQRFESPDDDTPAMEYLRRTQITGSVRAVGTKIWFNKFNQKHRETGPAVENPDGTGEYWLHNTRFANVDDWVKAGGRPYGKELNLEL